jgi:hypothetical protein
MSLPYIISRIFCCALARYAFFVMNEVTVEDLGCKNFYIIHLDLILNIRRFKNKMISGPHP